MIYVVSGKPEYRREEYIFFSWKQFLWHSLLESGESPRNSRRLKHFTWSIILVKLPRRNVYSFRFETKLSWGYFQNITNKKSYSPNQTQLKPPSIKVNKFCLVIFVEIPCRYADNFQPVSSFCSPSSQTAQETQNSYLVNSTRIIMLEISLQGKKYKFEGCAL
jgi:hypothetical protein